MKARMVCVRNVRVRLSEKRLEALPFARLCVACKSKRELMEKIERSEQRQ